MREPEALISYNFYGSWTGASSTSWSWRISHPKEIEFVRVFVLEHGHNFGRSVRRFAKYVYQLRGRALLLPDSIWYIDACGTGLYSVSTYWRCAFALGVVSLCKCVLSRGCTLFVFRCFAKLNGGFRKMSLLQFWLRHYLVCLSNRNQVVLVHIIWCHHESSGSTSPGRKELRCYDFQLV